MEFPLPDSEQIKQILTLKLRGVRRQFEVDSKSLLTTLGKKSGADIERILRRAIKRMILREQEFLMIKDVKQASVKDKRTKN